MSARIDIGRYKRLGKPKQRDGNSASHLANVRLLRCLVCGRPGPSDPHHVKRTGTLEPWGQRGMGMTTADRCAVPLCKQPGGCHAQVENCGDEVGWFSERGIQAPEIGSTLWSNRGDLPAMHRVIVRSLNDRGIFWHA